MDCVFFEEVTFNLLIFPWHQRTQQHGIYEQGILYILQIYWDIILQALQDHMIFTVFVDAY